MIICEHTKLCVNSVRPAWKSQSNSVQLCISDDSDLLTIVVYESDYHYYCYYYYYYY